MTAVYLEPQNGYKTPLRSDTLWGILCWAIRNVYGEDKLKDFIADYKGGNNNYTLTSCFPYIESDGKKTHYFPAPLLPVKHEKIEGDYKTYAREMTKRKKEKQRNFLTKEEFEHVLKRGEIPKNKSDISPKIDAFPVTRNTIDRLKGGTLQLEGGQLFHVDEYHVQVKKSIEKITDLEDKTSYSAGLFFLVKGDTQLLKGALRFLQHTGLGGDRTVGKGWFKITYDENFTLVEPTDGNACTTLSLYHPKEGEINDFKSNHDNNLKHNKDNDFLNYKIEMRGGKLGFFNYKQVQKDAIMMFEEGSVFPLNGAVQNQYGHNPIVLSPDPVNNPGLHHDVSHYGMGFMVKMKL